MQISCELVSNAHVQQLTVSLSYKICSVPNRNKIIRNGSFSAFAGAICWLPCCYNNSPFVFLYRFLFRRRCTCTSPLWRNSFPPPASHTTCLTCVTSRVSCLACYSFPPRTFRRVTSWSDCGSTRCTACSMTGWLTAMIESCSLTWWKRRQNSSSRKTWIVCWSTLYLQDKNSRTIISGYISLKIVGKIVKPPICCRKYSKQLILQESGNCFF